MRSTRTVILEPILSESHPVQSQESVAGELPTLIKKKIRDILVQDLEVLGDVSVSAIVLYGMVKSVEQEGDSLPKNSVFAQDGEAGTQKEAAVE